MDNDNDDPNKKRARAQFVCARHPPCNSCRQVETIIIDFYTVDSCKVELCPVLGHVMLIVYYRMYLNIPKYIYKIFVKVCF